MSLLALGSTQCMQPKLSPARIMLRCQLTSMPYIIPQFRSLLTPSTHPSGLRLSSSTCDPVSMSKLYRYTVAERHVQGQDTAATRGKQWDAAACAFRCDDAIAAADCTAAHSCSHKLTRFHVLECNGNHVTVTSEWQTSGMLLPLLRTQSQTTVHTEGRQKTKVDAPPLARVPWCHNVWH